MRKREREREKNRETRYKRRFGIVVFFAAATPLNRSFTAASQVASGPGDRCPMKAPLGVLHGTRCLHRIPLLQLAAAFEKESHLASTGNFLLPLIMHPPRPRVGIFDRNENPVSPEGCCKRFATNFKTTGYLVTRSAFFPN